MISSSAEPQDEETGRTSAESSNSMLSTIEVYRKWWDRWVRRGARSPLYSPRRVLSPLPDLVVQNRETAREYGWAGPPRLQNAFQNAKERRSLKWCYEVGGMDTPHQTEEQDREPPVPSPSPSLELLEDAIVLQENVTIRRRQKKYDDGRSGSARVVEGEEGEGGRSERERESARKRKKKRKRSKRQRVFRVYQLCSCVDHVCGAP